MREIDDLAWKAYKIPRGVMKRVKKILEGKGEEGLVSNWKRGFQTNTYFSVQHNPAGSNITHIVGNGTVINQGIGQKSTKKGTTTLPPRCEKVKS